MIFGYSWIYSVNILVKLMLELKFSSTSDTKVLLKWIFIGSTALKQNSINSKIVRTVFRFVWKKKLLYFDVYFHFSWWLTVWKITSHWIKYYYYYYYHMSVKIEILYQILHQLILILGHKKLSLSNDIYYIVVCI